MPMTDHPFAYHRTLAFRQTLCILDNRHVAFATDHKDYPFLMHAPSIVSVQVSAINHHGANLCVLSQITLGLLQERDQPAPLIVLDFDDLHGQREARLDLDENQHFPSIDVIFLGGCFFLSFDFDAAPLFELSAALIALWGGQFAAVQRRQQLALEEASSSEHRHHLVEEPPHLFFAELAVT